MKDFVIVIFSPKNIVHHKNIILNILSNILLYIRFHDKHDAEDAMEALNGRAYDGRDLKISMDAGRPHQPRY